MMCNEQGIQAYPTLRIYPKVKKLFFRSTSEKNWKFAIAARHVSRAEGQRDSRSLRDEFRLGQGRSAERSNVRHVESREENAEARRVLPRGGRRRLFRRRSNLQISGDAGSLLRFVVVLAR